MEGNTGFSSEKTVVIRDCFLSPAPMAEAEQENLRRAVVFRFGSAVPGMEGNTGFSSEKTVVIRDCFLSPAPMAEAEQENLRRAVVFRFGSAVPDFQPLQDDSDIRR